MVFMPEGRKGLQDNSRYLNGRIWTPYGLIQSGNEMPGENATLAIANLKKEVDLWIEGNAKIWDQYWLPFARGAQQMAWPEDWKVQK
jgi:hypothetical protein